MGIQGVWNVYKPTCSCDQRCTLITAKINKNQRYPKCVLLCGSWMFDFMIKLIKWVVWFLLFIFFSLAWILIDRCQTNSQWYEVNLQNDFERFVLFCWWVLQACHDVCFFGDVWPLYDLKEVGWRERFYQDGGTMWSLMCFDLDVKKHKKIETCTSPKFNIDPEKWWLEDKPFLLGFVTFQGRAVKLLGGYVYVLPPNHTTFVALQAGPIVKVYRR